MFDNVNKTSYRRMYILGGVSLFSTALVLILQINVKWTVYNEILLVGLLLTGFGFIRLPTVIEKGTFRFTAYLVTIGASLVVISAVVRFVLN